ncbi:MAG: type I glutamate--ammonia ligase [Acidobacteria bacterium]|nr:type I glutamate--ammonia ligase [Acidobacteriota bacterium]
MDSKAVMELIKSRNIQMVDLRFMDLPGLWQHFTVPAQAFSEDAFKDGVGFDGSSIRGWRSIHESDMIVIPDPQSAFIDPFFAQPTVTLICDILDPVTHEPYPRDPRNIALKATSYLLSTGIADTAFFGCEAEFFVFDDIRFDQTANSGYYFLDSNEGRWNSGREENPNLGYKPRYKEGYFPVPPTDSLSDLRGEMVRLMHEVGLHVEAHHHEVATAGQCEIDMRFDKLVQTADNLMKFKYVVKNTALRYGKTATFMPKPLFGDNGSGMHTHQSLWKKGQPLFPGNGYAGLSETALFYAGGLLKHARSLAALIAPTTNSYKRLVPGFEAPVNLAYSRRNRSASIRIPMYTENPKAKRLEFRPPDPSCNPYLALAAQLMAGLDGVLNRIDPGAPLDKDLYALPPEEMKNIPTMPGSLSEALDELERDHEFLLKGDVFTEDFIQTWIEYKRHREVEEMNLRPHPYEFALYFDI